MEDLRKWFEVWFDLGDYLRMFAQFEVIIVVSVEECVVARFEVKVAV